MPLSPALLEILREHWRREHLHDLLFPMASDRSRPMDGKSVERYVQTVVRRAGIVWHSCRHRACPQCGAAARAEWLARREAELLEVPYFHVVFTVPEQLNALALHAPRCFYDLLFRAAGATLLEIGMSRLAVRLGALAVLHTWTQTLLLHPHIHCVVPGGGFSPDSSRWKNVRNASFFLPVKVLSRRFRTNLTALLAEAWRSGVLTVPEDRMSSSDFARLMASVRTREWVVYAKPPFAGPGCVLRYLAGYTHRIAISNRRIEAFDGPPRRASLALFFAGLCLSRSPRLIDRSRSCSPRRHLHAPRSSRFAPQSMPIRAAAAQFNGFSSSRRRTA